MASTEKSSESLTTWDAVKKCFTFSKIFCPQHVKHKYLYLSFNAILPLYINSICTLYPYLYVEKYRKYRNNDCFD